MTYDDAMAYLDSLLPGPRPVLAPTERMARMVRLLRAAGLAAPHFPVVLVAGTKGKGSTAAMLAAMVSAAGRRVGLYTKPHVSDYRERIRTDGELIAPDALAAALGRVAPAVETVGGGALGRPTYFEVSIAVALSHFASMGVDLGILEVGVGGRFDAANALASALGIITPISRDHTDVLGTTLEEIARHKAGIMRPGRPVVVAPQPPAADAVLRAESADVGAPLVRVADAAEWTWGEAAADGQRFVLRTPTADYGLVVSSLRGRHQTVNAATAVVAAERLLGPVLTPEAVAVGLRAAVLPGRFEVLEGSPPVVLDVAHNPASMAALRDALHDYYPGRRVVALLGMTGAHDPEETVPLIAAHARLVVVTEPPHHYRAIPSARLADIVARHADAVAVEPRYDRALARARAETAADEVLCVTGSVYLVGAARDILAAEGARRRVG